MLIKNWWFLFIYVFSLFFRPRCQHHMLTGGFLCINLEHEWYKQEERKKKRVLKVNFCICSSLKISSRSSSYTHQHTRSTVNIYIRTLSFSPKKLRTPPKNSIMKLLKFSVFTAGLAVNSQQVYRDVSAMYFDSQFCRAQKLKK